MTGRDRLLVSGLAALAVLAGIWFLALAPKRAESGKLDAQIASARQALAAAGRESATAKSERETFATDSAALASIGKALPPDDQTASLLYQLDAAAGRSSVKLQSINPTVGAAAPTLGGAAATPLPAGVTEMSISLVFEGRFGDLQRFLRRVQGYTSVSGDTVHVRGRLLSVHGFELTAGEAKDGKVHATVTASAYIAGVAPAAGAAPGAQSAAAPPAQSASVSSAPPTTPATIAVTG